MRQMFLSILNWRIWGARWLSSSKLYKQLEKNCNKRLKLLPTFRPNFFHILHSTTSPKGQGRFSKLSWYHFVWITYFSDEVFNFHSILQNCCLKEFFPRIYRVYILNKQCYLCRQVCFYILLNWHIVNAQLGFPIPGIRPKYIISPDT